MSTMTDEAMRVAVGESLGWTCINDGSSAFPWLGTNPSGNMDKLVPNWAEDLNACAEMERTLTDEQHRWYVHHLMAWADDHLTVGRDAILYALATATARQRCEAYLRTVGGWIA